MDEIQKTIEAISKVMEEIKAENARLVRLVNAAQAQRSLAGMNSKYKKLLETIH